MSRSGGQACNQGLPKQTTGYTIKEAVDMAKDQPGLPTESSLRLSGRLSMKDGKTIDTAAIGAEVPRAQRSEPRRVGS